MTFIPRMTAHTRAMRTLRPLSWRAWGGVVADVWQVAGGAGGGGYYSSPDPRVVVFLDGAPKGFGLRTDDSSAWQTEISTLYVPPNVPLWSSVTQDASYTHLDLHLDAGPLHQRLSCLPTTAILGGASHRVQSLATMLADEVTAPKRPEMMLEGLLMALLTEVMDLQTDTSEQPQAQGGLAPHVIAALAKQVRANLDQKITVADLAKIAGLSESWFAKAFASSQGTTPQRWLTRLRLDRAETLIGQSGLSLAEIAAACGFSDQAHLTRQFKSAFGQSPAAWRRTNFARNPSNHSGFVQEPHTNPT